jgi:predicted acylesterase/phospholipase RssA
MAPETVLPKPSKRVLVVSGGGSRGAWGAGFASFLSKTYGPYKVAYGTSTGSLMIPFIITEKFDELREAYTSVTQKDIFNSNPFKDNGDLKIVNLLWRILLGKPSLGDTNNLRKLIEKFLTPDIYAQIRNQDNGLQFGVTVVNLRTAKRSVKCSADIDDINEMRDWMWASANQPLFMTYYPGKTDGFYVDGGVYDTIPILPALQYAADHEDVRNIDVIINQPKNPIVDNNCQPTTILKGLSRLVELWKTEVASDDVLIGLLTADVDVFATTETITINLYYFPPDLYPANCYDLQFVKEKMQALWSEGEKGNVQTEIHGPSKQIMVNRNKVKEVMGRMKDSYEA